jgi:hypothetical protein
MIYIYGGGCLICEGKNSCYTVGVYENADGTGDVTLHIDEFFEGYLGPNCPKDKKGIPSLPCFSGANAVEVQNKGITTVDSLEVGDRVKTGVTRNGQPQFSPVISLMHENHQVQLVYRQIFTNASHTIPLEISSDHYVYLHDDKVVRAKNIRAGDILKGDTANVVVTHIKTVQR